MIDESVGKMIRLLGLLGVAMFLTLLIGGQDRGQTRLGLSQAPLMPPLPPRNPEKTVEASAALADLVPVAAPAPARADPQAPVATPDLAVAAAPAPAAPTFTLSNIEEADIAATAVEPTKILYVAATSINVRQGPSTEDKVLDRLRRYEAVSLVKEAGDGWVQIRIEGDGIEGFVASRFLTDKAPTP